MSFLSQAQGVNRLDPKKTSRLFWKNFSDTDTRRRRRCGLCCETFPYRKSSTAQLILHLRKKHAIFVKLRTPRRRLTKKANEITKQLVTMVAKELHSVSIVDGTEFKRFINMLNPHYKLPTEHKLLTNCIPQYYYDVRASVANEIDCATIVSLAIDKWESLINDIEYVSVTAYFINDETELKFYLLECFPCHGATNLYTELCRVNNEWNLKNKICAIVTADRTDMVEVAALGCWDHIKCVAEKINRVVDKLIDLNESLRIKIKSVNKDLHLNSDVGSTWIVIDAYLKARHESDETIHNESERKELQKACNTLEVLKEIIDEIMQDNVVPLSKILIMCESFKRIIDRLCNNTINSKLKMILRDISNNYLYCEAALLDPRFKTYAFLGNEGYTSIIQAAANRATSFALIKNRNSAQSNKACKVRKQQSLIWDVFDTEFANTDNVNEVSTAGSIEIEKYLIEPCIDRINDPLMWWKSRQYVYPCLYQLMLRRLCIPGTAAFGTSCFTKAGRILARRKEQLSTQEAQKLIFLNFNIK